MARPLRLDYAGAVQHITSRGHQRRNIFRDNRDRRHFLELLAETAHRYGWLITAWTLMTNHFHLVIETPMATLSDGMQYLNGAYASWFNARHKRRSALFDGRFHSFVVEKEKYLQEVIRYVVLNPVRARMVERPEDYVWSSYHATAGLCAPPDWLALDRVMPCFGEADVWQRNYVDYVHEAIGSEERLWTKLSRQVYLGTEQWIASLRPIVESELRTDDHPRVQREIGRPHMAGVVAAVAKAFDVNVSEVRNGRGGAARMVAAFVGWYEGLLRLRQIAAGLRLGSQGRVSNLIRQCREQLARDELLRQLVRGTLDQLPA